MEKKTRFTKQIIVAALGTLLLSAIAIFSYRSVENTIIEREKQSLKSLAKANAQSFQAGMKAMDNQEPAALFEEVNTIEESENGRYCIVKNREGVTVMSKDRDSREISISHEAGNGCTIDWIYDTSSGTPRRTRKLIAYETIEIGEEEYSLYIIEDYDKVIQPIEQIAFYFCLLGIIVLVWIAWFIRRISEQNKTIN